MTILLPPFLAYDVLVFSDDPRVNRRPEPRGRNQKHNLNNLTVFLSVMGDRDNQRNSPISPQTARKKVSNMSKTELAAEVKQHRSNEEKYLSALNQMKKEIGELKDSLEELRSARSENCYNPQRNLEKRLEELERRMSDQEQYSRKKGIELVWLPSDLNGEELKNAVINTFETSGINIGKRNFHAVHRLAVKRTVIAKPTNRQDAIDILRQKKKLRTLSDEEKKN